jgi:urea carboxylase-associated protein 2
MPTIPATDATARPEGVDPASVVWDEVIEPGEYASHRLARGTFVRLTDLEGEACGHVTVHSARQPAERLNLADTVKVQWQAYPTTGTQLLSDMGRALMTILDDTAGRHDALCSAPNRASHEAKYGDGAVEGRYPNARDRLVVAALKAGFERRDVGPSISFFKGARVASDGSLLLDTGAPVGGFVTLRADLDVQLAVADVPHVLDRRPGYVCGPLRITAWRSSDGATPADGTETPERTRALLNGADWCRTQP